MSGDHSGPEVSSVRMLMASSTSGSGCSRSLCLKKSFPAVEIVAAGWTVAERTVITVVAACN